MPRTILDDGVVTLSPPTFADLDTITAACQDPLVAEWTTVPAPYLPEHARGFVTHVTDAWALLRANPVAPLEVEATWAVRTGGPAGAVLGMVGLRLEPPGSAELGYWLAPHARGQGLMTRAVRLALEEGLSGTGLGLERVTWSAYVGNWASWAVAWRCGFRLEGEVRGHGVQRGVRRDSWVATLLRGEPREPRSAWPGTPVVVTTPNRG